MSTCAGAPFLSVQTTIPLAGDESEAVFYMLDVGFSPTDSAQTEERALYQAVRELHEKRPREGVASSAARHPASLGLVLLHPGTLDAW